MLVCHSLCHSLLSPRREGHLLMLTLFRHQQASHELAGPVTILPLSYQQDIKGNHRTEGNREIISGILLPCTWGGGLAPAGGTGGWVPVSPVPTQRSLCCLQAVAVLKAVTESPGHTSDHSPVIQTYSQGCKLQLSRSAGRLLVSQRRP